MTRQWELLFKPDNFQKFRNRFVTSFGHSLIHTKLSTSLWPILLTGSTFYSITPMERMELQRIYFIFWPIRREIPKVYQTETDYAWYANSISYCLWNISFSEWPYDSRQWLSRQEGSDPQGKGVSAPSPACLVLMERMQALREMAEEGWGGGVG